MGFFGRIQILLQWLEQLYEIVYYSLVLLYVFREDNLSLTDIAALSFLRFLRLVGMH